MKKICIVNFWWSNNYGACLTAFALQNFCSRSGYKSDLLNYVGHWARFSFEKSLSFNFSRTFLSLTNCVKSIKDFNGIVKGYDIFITGSDQVFRFKYILRYFHLFLLFWVPLDKKRIAVAASIAEDKFSCRVMQNLCFKHALEQLDFISVRESSSVSLLRKNCKVESISILDPVFYLQPEDYEIICRESKLKINDRYILIYLLSPDEEVRANVLSWVKQMGGAFRVITSKNDVSDWLFLIKNAFFVVTDSYHGLCFSIIYHKPFYCLVNQERGAERFYSLKELLKLPNDSFIQMSGNFPNVFSCVNYDEVCEVLKRESARSQESLLKSLSCSPALKEQNLGYKFAYFITLLDLLFYEFLCLNKNRIKRLLQKFSKVL